MVELPESLIKHNPLSDCTHPIWLASSFSLYRNLAHSHFPHRLESKELKALLPVIKGVLGKVVPEGQFFSADEISALDKEFLFEHFLCIEGFQNSFAGQGFFVEQAGKFFTKVNICDHLQLYLLDYQGGWESNWMRLAEIENELSEQLEFAYSPKFGYLTSDFTACGTALLVHAFLHLPALIHTGQLKKVVKEHVREEVLPTSMGGSLEEIAGDLLILRNRYTLGISEEKLLSILHAVLVQLVLAESNLRSQLKKEESLSMRDHVARSFGLLKHSRQLETREALEALSLLKLGVDLGWVTGGEDKKITELLFSCRRAHLLAELNLKELEPSELLKKRAEYLQSQLKSISLAN